MASPKTEKCAILPKEEQEMLVTILSSADQLPARTLAGFDAYWQLATQTPQPEDAARYSLKNISKMLQSFPDKQRDATLRMVFEPGQTMMNTLEKFDVKIDLKDVEMGVSVQLATLYQRFIIAQHRALVHLSEKGTYEIELFSAVPFLANGFVQAFQREILNKREEKGLTRRGGNVNTTTTPNALQRQLQKVRQMTWTQILKWIFKHAFWSSYMSGFYIQQRLADYVTVYGVPVAVGENAFAAFYRQLPGPLQFLYGYFVGRPNDVLGGWVTWGFEQGKLVTFYESVNLTLGTWFKAFGELCATILGIPMIKTIIQGALWTVFFVILFVWMDQTVTGGRVTSFAVRVGTEFAAHVKNAFRRLVATARAGGFEGLDERAVGIYARIVFKEEFGGNGRYPKRAGRELSNERFDSMRGRRASNKG